MSEQTPDELDVQEVRGWAEFCSWAALVMAPIIWWLQGPSVSTDQFVVRTGLVVIAAVGGMTLRCLALFRKRRTVKSPVANSAPATRDA